MRPPFDARALADGLRALADEVEAGGGPRPGQGVRRVGGAPVVPVVVHDALCGVRVASRQDPPDDDVLVCAGCGLAMLADEVADTRE